MSFCRKSRFSVSSTSASLSSSAGKAAVGTPEPGAARLAAGTDAHPRAVLIFASEESDAKTPVRDAAAFSSVRPVRASVVFRSNAASTEKSTPSFRSHASTSSAPNAAAATPSDHRDPGPALVFSKTALRVRARLSRSFSSSSRRAAPFASSSRSVSLASCSSSRSARSNLRRTRSASPSGVRPALFRARTSAPASSNAATVSAPAMRAASVSGVSSRWSGGSTHVPGRDASARTTRARSCIAAKCRGARPSASSSFASTPCEHRSSTTSACPRAAANVIGRTPALSVASKVAPPAMSAATSSVRPRSHAVRSASARRRSSSASARRASIAEVRVDARAPAPRALAPEARRDVLETNETFFPERGSRRSAAARSRFGTQRTSANRAVTVPAHPEAPGPGHLWRSFERASASSSARTAGPSG